MKYNWKKRIAITLSALLVLSVVPTKTFADISIMEKYQQGEETLVEPEENVEIVESDFTMPKEELITDLAVEDSLVLETEVFNDIEEELAFNQSVELENISIGVNADIGVFPKDARLVVKKLETLKELQRVEIAVEEELQAEDSLEESMAFDIMIVDSLGQELQPDITKGEVYICFSQLDTTFLERANTLEVYHMENLNSTAQKLEVVEVDEDLGKVDVKTEHFSVYVVSAINKNTKQTLTRGLSVGDTVEIKTWLNMLIGESSKDKQIESIDIDNEAIIKITVDEEYSITALAEGKAKTIITFTDKTIAEIEVIVQPAREEVAVGENASFVISGAKGEMLLTIKGKGHIETTPWFVYKDYVKAIVIEEGILSLPMEAFKEFSKLEKVQLPNSLGIIQDFAFADCSSLRKIILPNSLKIIGESAFRGCNSLGDITIPESVISIGSYAFIKDKRTREGRKNKITNLSHFPLFDANENYERVGLENQGHYTSEYSDYEGTTPVGTPELPSYQGFQIGRVSNIQFLGSVGKGSFEIELSHEDKRYNELKHEFYIYKTTNLLESVTEEKFFRNGKLIESYHVEGESYGIEDEQGNIEKIIYMPLVSHKGWNMNRYNCFILAVMKNRDGSISISKIKKVEMRPEIAGGFGGETGDLSWRLNVKNGEVTLTISGNGVMDDYIYIDAQGHEFYDRNLVPWSQIITQYKLPSNYKLILEPGITRVGKAAFERAKIVGDLPNTITEIGARAFMNASFEKDLNLPDSITKIERAAFLNTKIEGGIKLPKNLKKIDISTFAYTNAEGDLEIPSAVEMIEPYAFHGANQLGKITIPETVKSLGTRAFYKGEMGYQGKNTIVNHSSLKINDMIANYMFTNFSLDNTKDEKNLWYKEIEAYQTTETSQSKSRGSRGGGGGGSRKASNTLSKEKQGNFGKQGSWERGEKGWKFNNINGSPVKNEWKQVGMQWYFFNAEGYMQKGWINQNGSWYYLHETEDSREGQMEVGWGLINNKWYFFGDNGQMRMGWLQINGKWYYLNETKGKEQGTMLFNTIVNGYRLGSDGTWVK